MIRCFKRVNKTVILDQAMDYSQTEELCPVCSDRVSGYHYGLLTCESCKGFFKRTVQNNKKYVCVESQSCRIDKAQRKRCPFCRFQKCLRVGMRLEAVRADRMRGGRNKFGPMYKWDRALKQQRRAQAPSSSYHGTYCTVEPTATSIPPPNTTSQTYTFYTDSNVTMEHLSFEEETQKPKMPPLVFELLRCDPDETQIQDKIQLWQDKSHWDKHSSLFTLMLSVAEHTLFSIVEWARTSVFFKQLEVTDQMTLLHNRWSELLLLDVFCRQVLNDTQGQLLLTCGHQIDFAAIGSQTDPILSSLIKKGQELIEKFLLLKMDRQEFVCLKFMIVFNTDGKQLSNRPFIETVQEQVRGALLEYALSRHCLGRFTQLLQALSEVHFLSSLAEDYLWSKHQNGDLPFNNLLTEMLYAKRSNSHHQLCGLSENNSNVLT